jgi:hypothetical protein
MPIDLYKKLSELSVLRRAWHLARDDSRTDFMYDPYRLSDFGFRLDEYLYSLSQSLARETYHPKPLLTIDVPKSSLSVRPGSTLSIEDKIVLFAIASLIAPRLDKKLPDNVYSWRVKQGTREKELFHDHEILKFPFLKHRTITKRIDFIEPWYGVWPLFIEKMEYAFKEEGYGLLVVSDIVSYFENLDIDLLRDILLQHLPTQQKIINFLINLLEYWTWPAVHGASSPRGIPQGNGVSSFLGNIFLLPLDMAFVKFSKRKDVKYLRYMDDTKVFAKDMSTAREALFLMNKELRGLRLNIQGSKTRILEDDEIVEELFDDRLVAVNDIIQNIQNDIKIHTNFNIIKRKPYVKNLKKILSQVKGRNKLVQGKELRLFRRLITAFKTLNDSSMVRVILEQLDRNPDERLLRSASLYLRYQDRNLKKISERLAKYLKDNTGLFPYQEAYFFVTLRFMRNIPNEAWKLARHHMSLKSCHWYVRQQAALLIGMKSLKSNELRAVQKIYKNEDNIEIKRALCKALAQLPREELENITHDLVFSVESKLQRLGRFFHNLLFDESKAKQQIGSLFNQFFEESFVDRLFEVEVISKTKHLEVKRKLLSSLKKVKREIRRPLLKDRIIIIIKRLEADVKKK